MHRRKFLSWLGTAAALPAFAPLAKLLAPATDPGVIHATLGEWHNYYSESDPEISAALAEYEAEYRIRGRARRLEWGGTMAIAIEPLV
jgi:hypothetical protein